MENFSHLSPMRVPSLMIFAVDPQLQSFHHGHQAISTVKLKVYTNGKICTVLSDPSGHSVIPISYQNHGESVTECSLLKSVLESAHFSFEPTDFSLLKRVLESPHFSFGTISPVFGMPTADDKNLDICPTLVNFKLQHWRNNLLPLTICWMKKMLIHSWMMRLNQ
jgi:hypothetical protein